MDLIAELVRRQGGEPDEQFAARLGITRMMWRFIVSGRNQPGRKTLRGIVQAYPDLKSVAVAFVLSPIDSQSTKSDSRQTAEEQPT